MKIDIQTTTTQQMTSAQADAFVKAHLGGIRTTLDERAGGYPAPFPLEGTDNNLPTAIQMTDGIYTDTRAKLLSAMPEGSTINGTEYQRVLDEEVRKVLATALEGDENAKITKAKVEACTSLPSFSGNKLIKNFDELENFIKTSSISLQNSSIESFKMPNKWTSMPSCRGCANLKSVVIPKSIVNTGWLPFYQTGLVRVEFADLQHILSLNVYSSDGLYNNPLYTAHHLFFSTSPNVEVTTIVIPDTCTTINSYVFCGGSYITSVTIPSVVNNIGSSAFYGCTSLATITYEGTCTQLKAITLGTKPFSGVKATYIQCTDGKVAITNGTIGDVISE